MYVIGFYLYIFSLGNGRISDPPRKLTPSMVSLPPREESLTAVKHTKSTSDLSKSNSSQQLRQSTPNVSADPRGGDPDNISNYQRNLKLQEKEQKQLEKQRLAEQKERDKAAAKEQAKQDKMREKARKEAETKAKRDKRKAPAPQQVRATAQTKPSIPQAERTNPAPKTNATYSSNTLESSISRSSGPPPYSERVQTNIEQSATSSNVTFSKPIDASSWDMISAHRQQLSRTTYEGKKHNKQTVMDLNYNFSNTIKEERDNSEV